MKSKLDFIARLDLFGKRIELYYDGKQKKKFIDWNNIYISIYNNLCDFICL